MSPWDGGEFYDSEAAWSVGDPVVLVSETPILHLARGQIVEIGLPGPTPIRVQVTGRRGVGAVLVREGELRRPPLPDPGPHGVCALDQCPRPVTVLSDRCLPHTVLAGLGTREDR